MSIILQQNVGMRENVKRQFYEYCVAFPSYYGHFTIFLVLFVCYREHKMKADQCRPVCHHPDQISPNWRVLRVLVCVQSRNITNTLPSTQIQYITSRQCRLVQEYHIAKTHYFFYVTNYLLISYTVSMCLSSHLCI